MSFAGGMCFLYESSGRKAGGGVEVSLVSVAHVEL